MTVHILDINDLSVVGIVHNYNSFAMTLNYSKIGDFTMSIDNRMSNAQLLYVNRIVMLEDNGLYTGIITHVSIDIDEDGKEMRVVKGRTLGHILSYRVVNSNGTNEYNFEQGNTETIIKQYIEKNAVDAVDSNRNFDNLMIADDKGRGNELRWQSKFDDLSEIIEEIAEFEEMGWYVQVDIDRNILIVDVYEGRDLSGEVVFSTQYGNLKSQSYTYDEYTNKNFAYVAGEINDLEVKLDEDGEIITETETIIDANTGKEITIEKPKQRRIYQVGNNEATGFDRRETFIEVNESQDKYIDIPELGLRRLQDMTDLETVEARVMDNSIFKYGEDYELGDIVSVYDEDWGITKDLRISSITIEIDENNDFEIYLTFGAVLPLLKDKIKQDLKALEPYTKK